MTIIFDTAPQGSPEWLAARRGRITGSRCKDARDKTAKGQRTAKAMLYAMDCARERVGGTVHAPYVNAAMRMGTEQEPRAREAYEAHTGALVLEAGFAHTDDGKFGVSVDGLIGTDGMWECKTMVSSDTLFTAVVDGDISAYRDQILMSLWLLNLKWCDLTLWAPDLECIGRALTIVRIERDEDEIDAMALDLINFDSLVEQYRARLDP